MTVEKTPEVTSSQRLFNRSSLQLSYLFIPILILFLAFSFASCTPAEDPLATEDAAADDGTDDDGSDDDETTTEDDDAPVLASIAISPADPSVAVGSGQQFSATGTYDDASTIADMNVSWSTTDTAVATVDSDGLATGVAVGTASVGHLRHSLRLHHPHRYSGRWRRGNAGLNRHYPG